MEPVTHVLTGACLARAGFNRRAAYATLTMAIAAELPDIDTLWGLRGPVEGFAHHRGITHTFVALPFEAAALVGAMYALHGWRMARARRRRVGPTFTTKPITKAPVRWWALFGCALVALLSHLLLDYTNNYGLRPFYPFDTHWYAASIVFIFDPVIFALLVAALTVPSLFGLVNAEVGAKRTTFRGRGLAIAALVGVLGWWGLRAVEHERALAIAGVQSYQQDQAPVAVTAPVVATDAASTDVVTAAPVNPAPTDALGATQSAPAEGDAVENGVDLAVPSTNSASAPQQVELVQPAPVLLTVRRALASPSTLDPFRWSVAMDYGPLIQLATVDTNSGAVATSEVTYANVRFPGAATDAAMRTAEASSLGRVYLDWSSMPIITEDEATANAARPSARVVTFRDARFMGGEPWLQLTGTTPLTGVVTVNGAGRVVRQAFDGRVQRHLPVLVTDLSRRR